MRNIVMLSGGKDSAATLLHCIEKGIEFEAVFCDTGNEADVTYTYLKYLEQALGFTLFRISPPLDFYELAVQKKRFASPMRRFCTSELKVKPFIDWLLTQTGTFRIYQGIRADESAARAGLNEVDDYFLSYHAPQAKVYQKTAVLKWLRDGNEAIVRRPLIQWTIDDVVSIHQRHGIKLNPLYLKGVSRVGCWPCVMCRHSELAIIGDIDPDRINKVAEYEERIGRTFFKAGYAGGIGKGGKGRIWGIKKCLAYAKARSQEPMAEGLGLQPKGCISPLIVCE